MTVANKVKAGLDNIFWGTVRTVYSAEYDGSYHIASLKQKNWFQKMTKLLNNYSIMTQSLLITHYSLLNHDHETFKELVSKNDQIDKPDQNIVCSVCM